MSATFSALRASATGSYFSLLANERYYDDGGERRGIWFGRGSHRMSLGKYVNAPDFTASLRGFHPGTNLPLLSGAQLNPPKRGAHEKGRVPGYDVTFSVPKTVSAYWAITDAEMRQRIEQACIVSLIHTFHWAEDHLPLARRSKRD